MTIVHLAGMTPNGLMAALMVCGGLTKVKLHKAFKPMMPLHMLKNVEARGCSFQWINMVCGGLTKVKLHKAFKPMMPLHMLKNVEARGCSFQWINKPFKVLFIYL
jgi:hypothetical protein